MGLGAVNHLFGGGLSRAIASFNRRLATITNFPQNALKTYYFFFVKLNISISWFLIAKSPHRHWSRFFGCFRHKIADFENKMRYFSLGYAEYSCESQLILIATIRESVALRKSLKSLERPQSFRILSNRGRAKKRQTRFKRYIQNW